jgi:PKD repeat protein
MPEARARKLAEDPRVESVEQNAFISTPVGDCYLGTPWADPRALPSPSASPQMLNCSDPDPLNDTQTSSPICQDNWGIDRIDQISGRNNQHSFINNGGTTHVYVMDTGIRWSHREFLNASGATRVSGGVDARQNPVVPGNSTNTNDCYGHGTHVAGIAAGRTFGVAKNAAIHPVRTIGCPTDPLTNQQFIDNTIRGLNWVVSEVTAQRSGGAAWPSVINWSGGNHTIFTGNNGLQTAVQNVVNNNVVLVQAAGNQSGDYTGPASLVDACQWSFGGTHPQVIVAGGFDYNEGRWTRRPQQDPDDAQYCGNDCGSNGGSCIDIWSPSTHVIASNMSGNNLTCHLSGTSMAAPHVAGVVAIYLQSNPFATAAQVEQALRSRGTWGFLQTNPNHPNFIGRESDNVLLHSDTRSIGDTAPVASFTFNCPGRQCTFNASGSTDNASIASYDWRFAELANGTGVTQWWTFAANFSGQVALKVTDSTGKTDHVVQNVAVNADAPPTASFTHNCTGFTCTFNSSGSGDDVSIASRTWSFGDNTPNGPGTAVTHTYAAAGTYLVRLTVTDNVGQFGIDEEGVPVIGTLSPPANVIATASGATVQITWTTVSGADGYNVERKVSSGSWQLAQSVNGGATSIAFDTPTTASGVVVYRVIARAGTTMSAPSNHDVAYVGTFSNDPLTTSPPTPVKAEHITEMRRAVNALRDLAGQVPVYSPTDVDPDVLRGQPVDDAPFVTLMTNLNTARSFVALPPVGFRTTAAAPGPVSNTQLEDLRLGLK